jgi:hypothetical protein
VRRSLFHGNASDSNDSPVVDFLSYSTAPTLAQALIENCTFHGNKNGSGIVLTLQADATIRSSTFFANAATLNVLDHAVVEVFGANVELTSNLFGANGAPDLRDGSRPGGSVRIGFNLFESQVGDLPPSVPCASATVSGYNLCGVNAPWLGPLANNGGPTQTMALLAGSPAIDAGANPGGLATDQRGAGFTRTAGARTDIGAYERTSGGASRGSTPKP